MNRVYVYTLITIVMAFIGAILDQFVSIEHMVLAPVVFMTFGMYWLIRMDIKDNEDIEHGTILIETLLLISAIVTALILPNLGMKNLGLILIGLLGWLLTELLSRSLKKAEDWLNSHSFILSFKVIDKSSGGTDPDEV